MHGQTYASKPHRLGSLALFFLPPADIFPELLQLDVLHHLVVHLISGARQFFGFQHNQRIPSSLLLIFDGQVATAFLDQHFHTLIMARCARMVKSRHAFLILGVRISTLLQQNGNAIGIPRFSGQDQGREAGSDARVSTAAIPQSGARFSRHVLLLAFLFAPLGFCSGFDTGPSLQ